MACFEIVMCYLLCETDVLGGWTTLNELSAAGLFEAQVQDRCAAGRLGCAFQADQRCLGVLHHRGKTATLGMQDNRLNANCSIGGNSCLNHVLLPCCANTVCSKTDQAPDYD